MSRSALDPGVGREFQRVQIKGSKGVQMGSRWGFKGSSSRSSDLGIKRFRPVQWAQMGPNGASTCPNEGSVGPNGFSDCFGVLTIEMGAHLNKNVSPCFNIPDPGLLVMVLGQVLCYKYIHGVTLCV